MQLHTINLDLHLHGSNQWSQCNIIFFQFRNHHFEALTFLIQTIFIKLTK